MLFRNAMAALAAVGLAAGACLAADPPYPPDDFPPVDLPKPPPDVDTRPCENHPTMDLAAYAAAYSAVRSSYPLPKPEVFLVPRGLTIENKPLRYVVHGTAQHALTLPILDGDKWDSANYLRLDTKVTSPCRVRDASGKMWVVLRNNDLSLDYYEPGNGKGDGLTILKY